MYLALGEDDLAYRDLVRAYFTGLLHDEVPDGVTAEQLLVGPDYRRLIARMGADGWLTVSWPRAYGGGDLSALRQLLFFDETDRAGVPYPVLTVNSIGPTLMRHGTEAQRSSLLPAIARGELHFAVGYSEPQAGTDLASLQTRARRVDGGYVVNGQKMWTSMVHQADYVWLACRTDPEAPRHAGISLLLVPTDAEGFSFTQVRTLADDLTAASYYEDVFVPDDHRVGPENGGWGIIVEQLNHERLALAPTGALDGLIDAVAARVDACADDTDLAWCRRELSRLRARVHGQRLLTWQVAHEIDHGQIDPTSASVAKVHGSELRIEVVRALMTMVGHAGLVAEGQAGQQLAGRLELELRLALIRTFGGGTNEIQRDIIATLGRGLPRSR